MYQVKFTLSSQKALKALDKAVAERIIEKIKWLAEHGDDVIHHQLTSMPGNLKGLCRLRVSEWRVLYWAYSLKKRIVIYGIVHRSEAYRGLS